jgi:peptide/nickel transport system permease protein
MWQGLVRFARNRMALFGAAVLLCLLLIVALTPLIYPNDPRRSCLAAAGRTLSARH